MDILLTGTVSVPKRVNGWLEVDGETVYDENLDESASFASLAKQYKINRDMCTPAHTDDSWVYTVNRFEADKFRACANTKCGKHLDDGGSIDRYCSTCKTYQAAKLNATTSNLEVARSRPNLTEYDNDVISWLDAENSYFLSRLDGVEPVEWFSERTDTPLPGLEKVGKDSGTPLSLGRARELHNNPDIDFNLVEEV